MGRPFGASLLDQIETAFTLVSSGPHPLDVSGQQIGHGLPARRIAVDELRCILLHPSTSQEARQAAWKLVVESAQTGQPEWTLAAVGLALPGLRNAAARIATGFVGSTEDLDAELVAGFVDLLRHIDPHAGNLWGRLCWAAFKAGHKLRVAEIDSAQRRVSLRESQTPRLPSGHPDLVLARAVRVGILTIAEASLIGETRLQKIPLTVLSRQLGVSADALRMRRKRAETRLVEAIRSGNLDEENPT